MARSKPDYAKIWQLEEELELPHTVEKPVPVEPEYYYIFKHRVQRGSQPPAENH